MTAVRSFYTAIADVQQVIGAVFGVSIKDSSQEIRATTAASAATLAVVLRALEDKGVLLPADVIAAWNAAQAEDWSGVIVAPPPAAPPRVPEPPV